MTAEAFIKLGLGPKQAPEETVEQVAQRIANNLLAIAWVGGPPTIRPL